MKTTATLKTSLSILFFFTTILVFGQKRYSLSLQLKQGITGIEKDQYQNIGLNQFYETVISGGDFSIGLDNEFIFFKKKYLSGSIGVLWNYNSFMRKEKVVGFDILSGETTGFERNFRYTSHSIIFPFSLNTRIKKIGFSLGMIPRYHVKTKMSEERLYFSSASIKDYDVQSITYEAGKEISSSPFNRGYGVDVSLQTKMDIQFLIGINYFLNDKFSLELEYKDIIDVNYIQVHSVDNSDSYNNKQGFNFNSRAITLGLNWRLF